MKTKKQIIEEASQKYGKMWDIKPHVLAGQLWWKDAMEDALDIQLKDELEFLEYHILGLIKETSQYIEVLNRIKAIKEELQ